MQESLIPQYPLDAEVLGSICSAADLLPSSAKHNTKGSYVTWSLRPPAHLVSKVLSSMHCVMINSFGNQYTVSVWLHKMRLRPCSNNNNETAGVYHPAEAKLNIKGHLLGHSSLGHSEVDVSISTCSNKKYSQHSFIFTWSMCLSWDIFLKAWEIYPVLNNRLPTHKLPKGESIPRLR